MRYFDDDDLHYWRHMKRNISQQNNKSGKV